jgi:hypothetical protein
MPLLGSCAGMNRPPHAGQPTVQGESMQHMLADVNVVRAYVYGGSSQTDAVQAATDLVAWSQRMAELFPPGQASQDYVDMSPQRAGNAPAAMQRTASSFCPRSRPATGPPPARSLPKRNATAAAPAI